MCATRETFLLSWCVYKKYSDHVGCDMPPTLYSISNSSFPGTYLAHNTKPNQSPVIRQKVLSPGTVIMIVCHKVMSNGSSVDCTSCNMKEVGSVTLGANTTTPSVLRCSRQQRLY